MNESLFLGVITDQNFSGALSEEVNVRCFLPLLNNVIFWHVLVSLNVFNDKVDYFLAAHENLNLTERALENMLGNEQSQTWGEKS